MKILTGNSNKQLSNKISKNLKNKLVNTSIRKFADGEIYIEINENIRGNSIFIIQSVSFTWPLVFVSLIVACIVLIKSWFLTEVC